VIDEAQRLPEVFPVLRHMTVLMRLNFSGLSRKGLGVDFDGMLDGNKDFFKRNAGRPAGIGMLSI
jgi:hypothetical protein